MGEYVCTSVKPCKRLAVVRRVRFECRKGSKKLTFVEIVFTTEKRVGGLQRFGEL